jgi:hypothetical protein
VNADTQTKHLQMLASPYSLDGQFIHNWPELAQFLISKLTDYVGTLHTNWKIYPPPPPSQRTKH